MKAIRSTGIILAAALLSVKVMAQQTEELRVPLSDPGKPYRLNVGLVTGSIKITGYDGKEVIVEASGESRNRTRKSEDDDERKSSGGMRRINTSGGLDVSAKEKNNQVTIGTDMPNRTMSLSIKIPNGLSTLKVECINNGNITISNVSGDIEATNINGNVILTDVAGSVVASSVNGTVKATFKSVDSKAPMAFSTLNGSVDVTFPANLRANVKLKSDRGGVYTDFDINADKQIKSTTKSAKDGMYRISIDETIYGKVNGGGPEVMMKTMNGSIYMRKGN
jgi:DUF4097 and DUF4098 domain-containing protein YvlB